MGQEGSGIPQEASCPGVTPSKRHLPILGPLPADEALAAAEVFTFGRAGGLWCGLLLPRAMPRHGQLLLLAKPQPPAPTLCSQLREIVHDEFKLKVKSQHKLESQ